MTERRTDFAFGENEQAKRLALALQALDDLATERAVYLAEWKERLTRLQAEATQIRREILTGQGALPLEKVES